MKKITALVLAMAMIFAFTAYGAELTYNETIKPIYEDANVFNEGFAAVKLNGKWGYIDKNGEKLSDFVYDFAASFSESKAIVGKLVKSEKITDTNGLTHTKYDMEMYFLDSKGNEKPFILDGKPFVAEDFDISKDLSFYGGITEIKSMGKSYFFMSTGELFPYIPKYIPTEGKMIFWNEDDISAGINVTDMEGNILFQMSGKPDIYGYQTTRIYPYNQGMALANVVKFSSDGKILEYGYGFIDGKGKFITPPFYRDFYRSGTNSYKIFNDGGLASIMQSGKYGAVDKNNNIRIPFIYDKLFTFQEGLAPFMLGDKWGVMDIYGNIIVAPKYENITRFNNGLAIAYDGEKPIIIDRHGKEVKELIGIDLSAYIYTYTTADGKKSISSTPPSDMLIVSKNGKYGYLELNFKPTLPTDSDADSWAVAEIVKAIENNLVPNELQNIYRENITREDFATLLCTLLERHLGKDISQIVLDKTGKTIDNFINAYPFNDAFNKYVIGANALGLINGTGNKTFSPNDYITRQDASAMLERLCALCNQGQGTEAVSALADFNYVSAYTQNSVKFVQSIGIMKGTGGEKFSPLGFYTKQQAILTIYRLFEVLK